MFPWSAPHHQRIFRAGRSQAAAFHRLKSLHDSVHGGFGDEHGSTEGASEKVPPAEQEWVSSVQEKTREMRRKTATLVCWHAPRDSPERSQPRAYRSEFASWEPFANAAGDSTHCLQSGAECNYPPTSRAQPDQSTSASEGQLALVAPTNPSCALSDYVGGSFDALPAASKRLLQHFSLYAIQGQKPVARRLESTAIQRAFENPGYMHMCLMLSACQWAWVTGSMDAVRIPFLHHKAATYQFVRQQLQSHETAQGGDTMLAISALALTEGAVGELNASSKHLQGIRMATQGGYVGQASSLPQRMLKMIGNGLRTGRSAKLVNVPDYQPTFMALLFASIWDVTTLPPREAPRYGWWEESDTQAARLWQNYTKDLNLNYEISRGFGSTDYIPQILNGDPRSSRTSFIATFFYLCSEMGHQHLDVVLIDWLLEQLIDDVKMGEDQMASSTWSQPLWLWCVMFGAAIASLGRPTNTTEERQLQKWKDVYDEKIRLLNHLLGFDSWHSAKALMAAIAGPADEDVDLGLQQLWDKAVNGDSNATLGRS